MAGVLHGSACTTPRVGAELQASQETTGVLARRYGLSRTTVAKWRTRTSTADPPMGSRNPRSTVLTLAEEAVVVEFRRRTSCHSTTRTPQAARGIRSLRGDIPVEPDAVWRDEEIRNPCLGVDGGRLPDPGAGHDAGAKPQGRSASRPLVRQGQPHGGRQEAIIARRNASFG